MSSPEASPPRSQGILASLTRPMDTWNALSGMEKYVLYARWSIISAVPMLAGMLILAVLVSPPPHVTRSYVPWTVAVLGVMVVQAIATSLAADRHPDLNVRERKPHEHVFLWSLVFNAVMWAGALVGLSVSNADAVRMLCMVEAWFSAMLVGLIHAAWLRHRWIIMITVSAITALVTASTVGPAMWLWCALPPFFLGITQMVLWTVRIFREADRARQLEADLALSEERLRIAQELHDTMGQHLAAMSLKSQVALALAQRGDPRLEHELLELQKLTQVSSSDMREVVRGFRDINLATEIAGARSLLTNAGITVTVHGASLDVPEDQRSIAAWFVRECATNIVRHSSATTATLTLTDHNVDFVNDGATNPMGPTSGLGALRRRAERAGATIATTHAEPEFRATLRLAQLDKTASVGPTTHSPSTPAKDAP